MARTVVCPCGSRFTTEQLNRRKCYRCSPARLKPAERLPDAVPDDAPPVAAPAPRTFGKITANTVSELERLGWLDTVEGSIAEALARDLDGPELTGPQRTSMSKQLTTMMDDIRATAPKEPTVIDSWRDKLRRKREQA